MESMAYCISHKTISTSNSCGTWPWSSPWVPYAKTVSQSWRPEILQSECGEGLVSGTPNLLRQNVVDGLDATPLNQFKNRLDKFWLDLDARAEAAKVQPKNVWAEAEPNFGWAEARKCLSQPSRAEKKLTS